MNLDERAYCLVNPSDRGIAAVGVKLLDRADFLVGVYLFWESYKNPESSKNPLEFLSSVVRDFGEARLYALNKHYQPGLICKMSIDVPHLILLPDDRLQLDLLEMRASNPKPFLGLHYDASKQQWSSRPLLALRCIDSNWSYIPN